jgi:hypothetical protein
MSKETDKCQKRPTLEGKETYYGRKRDPQMSKETHNVKRDPQMSKETYYGRKRDLP